MCVCMYVCMIGALLEKKSSNHSTKCRGDRSTYPLETRRKYAGPFAGIKH